MKIEEILPESLPCGLTNHPFPESTNAIKINQRPLLWKFGDLDVYELKDTDYSYYFVKDKYNSVVARAKVVIFQPPYAQVVFVKSEVTGKQIMSGLFTFLVRDYGLKLLSDSLMTDAGVKLWKSLPSTAPSLVMSVVDFYDGSQYDINDVNNGKCKTQDDMVVILPEKDNKPTADNPTDLKNNPKDKQRFYYIVESQGHINARKYPKHPIFEGFFKYQKVKNNIPFPPYIRTYDYYEFGDIGD